MKWLAFSLGTESVSFVFPECCPSALRLAGTVTEASLAVCGGLPQTAFFQRQTKACEGRRALHRTAAGSGGHVYVEWRLQTDLWILRGPRSQAGHGPPPSWPCWCAPASPSDIDVCSAVIHNRVRVPPALRPLLSDTVPWSGYGTGSVEPRVARVRCASGGFLLLPEGELWRRE